MPWYAYVSYFFGGAFLANAVPHFVRGAMGQPFQSPFAKPPGKGLSSSTVNVIWGWFNLAVGWALIWQVAEFDLHDPGNAGAASAGALAMGLMLARTFGRLHGGNEPGKP